MAVVERVLQEDPDLEGVLWLDTDATVHAVEKKFEEVFVNQAAHFFYAGDHPYPESKPGEWSFKFNAGVWFVRGSAEGRALMSEWLALYKADHWSHSSVEDGAGWRHLVGQWAGIAFEQGAFQAHFIERRGLRGPDPRIEAMDIGVLQGYVPGNNTFTLHWPGVERKLCIRCYLRPTNPKVLLQGIVRVFDWRSVGGLGPFLEHLTAKLEKAVPLLHARAQTGEYDTFQCIDFRVHVIDDGDSMSNYVIYKNFVDANPHFKDKVLYTAIAGRCNPSAGEVSYKNNLALIRMEEEGRVVGAKTAVFVADDDDGKTEQYFVEMCLPIARGIAMGENVITYTKINVLVRLRPPGAEEEGMLEFLKPWEKMYSPRFGSGSTITFRLDFGGEESTILALFPGAAVAEDIHHAVNLVAHARQRNVSGVGGKARIIEVVFPDEAPGVFARVFADNWCVLVHPNITTYIDVLALSRHLCAL